MDMSAACLPPRQPAISEFDRKDPLFNEYMKHRTFMSNKLLEASSFQNWKYQHLTNLRNAELEKHPRCKEFRQWMYDTRGGKPGKTKMIWPENFLAWLDGARW